MNQPHLSKIIRELERDLGCDIFDRTSRGMVPTKKGEEFLRYAKAILVQEEQIEALCVKNSEKALEVNLCVFPEPPIFPMPSLIFLSIWTAVPLSMYITWKPIPGTPSAVCQARPLTWALYAVRPCMNLII